MQNTLFYYNNPVVVSALALFSFDKIINQLKEQNKSCEEIIRVLRIETFYQLSKLLDKNKISIIFLLARKLTRTSKKEHEYYDIKKKIEEIIDDPNIFFMYLIDYIFDNYQNPIEQLDLLERTIRLRLSPILSKIGNTYYYEILKKTGDTPEKVR